MRISDWSSDVCSSDLSLAENSQDSISTLYIVLPLWSGGSTNAQVDIAKARQKAALAELAKIRLALGQSTLQAYFNVLQAQDQMIQWNNYIAALNRRSEEHTSELKSLMRTSYAVF